MKIKSLLNLFLFCFCAIQSSPNPDNATNIAFDELKKMVDKNVPEHENEFTQNWSKFEQIYGLEKVNWSFKKLAVYFDVPLDVLISCVQNNKELFPEYDRFSVSGMKEQAFDNNNAKNIARKLEYIQTGACLRPEEIKIFEE